jgi:hypothetical protein
MTSTSAKRFFHSLVLFTAMGAVALASDTPPLAISPGPSAGSQIASACPTFHWGAVADARVVELIVYKVSEAATPGESIATEPALRTTLPGEARLWAPSHERCLEPGERYAWSVRAHTEDASGAWSEASLFQVAAAPTVAEVEQAMAVLREYVAAGGEVPVDAPTAPATPANVVSGSGSALGATPAAAPLSGTTVGSAGPSRQNVVATSYDLTTQYDISLGGFVFKDGYTLLHDSGMDNIAVGRQALESLTYGTGNASLGYQALQSNATGNDNVAIGPRALIASTGGFDNVAIGRDSLAANYTGDQNVGIGTNALNDNTTGGRNTVIGYRASSSNALGSQNVAVGNGALSFTTDGSHNVAVGPYALSGGFGQAQYRNVGLGTSAGGHGGTDNVFVGYRAGQAITSGYGNVVLGANSAGTLSTGYQNIIIGADAAASDESGKIRIGAAGTHTDAFVAGVFGNATAGANYVHVTADGQLVDGPAVVSSRKYKTHIRELGARSRALLDLRPVAFEFKDGIQQRDEGLQFGLIAEEVAEVLPELVVRDESGEIHTVKYRQLSSLLVNELQRQHRQVQWLWTVVGTILVTGVWLARSRGGLG